MISNLNEIENDQNLLKIEYQTFENLLPFSNSEDYDKLYDIIIAYFNDDTNWLNQFEALNFLRRLNKYCPIIFNSILPNIVIFITKFTSSLRSNLSKLSIMLIKEIFYSKDFSSTNFKLLKNLISAVTFQSASMKSFIKEESLVSLDALTNNFIFHNTFTLNYLIEEISSKSLLQSENSFNSSIKLIYNWTREDIFSGTNYLQWQGILIQIINIYSLKREPYIKRACKLLENLYTKFGEEDFQNILNSSSLGEIQKNLILSILKQADTKKKKTNESFRDHISKNKFK